jgi:3-hydroxy acid dehydrogenase / malonic semialdehyde reductase
MKTVLITGATSGIGEACALKFAENKYQLILTGRREERLKELQKKIEKNYQIKSTILCFDVKERAVTLKKINDVLTNQKIDILINNAGLAAGRNPIDTASIDDFDNMIDTNIKGLLYVTKAVIPFMKEQNSGHIFNIASVAGKYAYANGNVYCASKHAVDALSKTMRIDLLPYNIKVSNIAPGAVETEFSIVRFKGDIDKAKNIYNGFTPLKAKDIAEVIFFTSTQPEHVCLSDITITPTAQADVNNIKKKEAL